MVQENNMSYNNKRTLRSHPGRTYITLKLHMAVGRALSACPAPPCMPRPLPCLHAPPPPCMPHPLPSCPAPSPHAPPPTCMLQSSDLSDTRGLRSLLERLDARFWARLRTTTPATSRPTAAGKWSSTLTWLSSVWMSRCSDAHSEYITAARVSSTWAAASRSWRSDKYTLYVSVGRNQFSNWSVIERRVLPT